MSPDFSTPIEDALREASALLQSGDYRAGATALRHLMEREPLNPDVASTVTRVLATARAWLGIGRTEQAVALLAPLAASTYASNTALMLYAHGLMVLGQKPEAEIVLRRWLQREPGSRDASLRLAAVLADTRRAAEAEAMVRHTIGRSGASADAAFVLGRALLGQSRLDEAEAEFRKVVQESPAHQTAQTNLMELVWMRTGDIHAATHAVDAVLRGRPDLTGLRISKASLLASIHRGREALAEVDAGLAMMPADPSLLVSAVSIALGVDAALAYSYARRLPASTVHDRAAQIAKGSAALATGRAPEALAIADALCSLSVADGRAIALRADALRMCGDNRYRELLDYRRLVSAGYLDVPAGWPDLAAYMSELVRDVSGLHTLEAPPVSNSLRNGSQIELDPAHSRFASIRAFPQAIDGAIRRYMHTLGRGTDPMRCRNTDHYALSGMWSVRLRSHGYHVSHHHPDGWISSACYLRVPPAVGHGGAGWLQFGEPPFSTTPRLSAEYMIRPEPGLLVLFPSYMWHGTVPFVGAATDTRLTVAFDVLPV